MKESASHFSTCQLLPVFTYGSAQEVPDFLRAWRSMAYTDVAYKLIAFCDAHARDDLAVALAAVREHPTGLRRMIAR